MEKQTKKTIIDKYAKQPGDTGSPEVQIAILTERINALVEHMKTHRKDFSTRRSLLVLVGQRRGLLNYLKDQDIDRYRTLIVQLKLRK